MIINQEWHGEINAAIENCIRQAKTEIFEVVEFEFNGVTVYVAGDSNAKLIYRDWVRGMSGYLGDKPTVGPYPSVMLSEPEIESDKRIKKMNAERLQKSDDEYQQLEQAKRLLLAEALSVTGPIGLIDQPAWDQFVAKNKDGYGAGVVRYADNWARLMQARLANGESIADCADETSHLADGDGITGFMYGCAVSMLAKTWKHGEALRRWHNNKTQLGDEGDRENETDGVLNPALLSIG